ncbi:MAG: hypothetical protein JRG67_13125, partial [Deltaproteobacteria bacterium]|nr:hypothetical protein [Deltaproteobacteria bacterium]
VVEERGERLYENGRAWVDEHPIEGQLFVRPTAGADLAGLVPETKQGGLKAVASLEETFRDLNDRITILTVQMPVEARWQAEYLTNSLFEERVQGPTDSMPRADPSHTNQRAPCRYHGGADRGLRRGRGRAHRDLGGHRG